MDDFRSNTSAQKQQNVLNPADFAMDVFSRIGGERRYSDDGKFVDMIFPTVEGASAFKTRYERDIGGKFLGLTIRWRGREWINKPECKAFQADVLAGLQKWTTEKHYSERSAALMTCGCYNCKHRLKDRGTGQV